MIYLKKWVDNPDYVPGTPRTSNAPGGKWTYEDLQRELRVDDIIGFTCNGYGRGGHYHVSGVVTKVNRKTVDVTEIPRSYHPGTLWRLHKERELAEGYITVEQSWIPLITEAFPDGIHYKARR